jgi:hypothetical protein
MYMTQQIFEFIFAKFIAQKLIFSGVFSVFPSNENCHSTCYANDDESALEYSPSIFNDSFCC